MSNVTVKLNYSKISNLKQKGIKGLFKLGYDIAAQARRNAPYQTGALRNSIRVEEANNSTIEVIAGGSFGGKSVPYAYKREEGPNKDPSTEHYMENAQKLIMSGNYIQKYFGDIT